MHIKGFCMGWLFICLLAVYKGCSCAFTTFWNQHDCTTFKTLAELFCYALNFLFTDFLVEYLEVSPCAKNYNCVVIGNGQELAFPHELTKCYVLLGCQLKGVWFEPLTLSCDMNLFRVFFHFFEYEKVHFWSKRACKSQFITFKIPCWWLNRSFTPAYTAWPYVVNSLEKVLLHKCVPI